MKRVLSVLGVLVLATSAMAVPTLVAMPKVTNAQDSTVQVGTLPTSITPDGAYIGGTAGLAFLGSGVDTGFVYNVASGTSAHVIAGGYQGSVNGIGYQYPTAGGRKLVIGGSNSGWQSMNTSADGATWTKVRRTDTHAYGGGSNTVAGSGGPVVYGTFFTPNSGTPNLYVDAITDGNAWASAPDVKGTSSAAVVLGVSSTGVAVGYRQVSSVNNNYVLTFEGDGGLGAAYVAGLAGDNRGELWDIADNGTYAGGASPKSDDSRLWAYVRNMSTGNVYALPTIGGPNTQTVTVSRVYGMSPDGNYAVGMDYSYGMEKAVLWDLHDINNITALDLTQYATDHGILGAFTGNLRRAYAMGIDAQGNPVITGTGYASSLEADGWTGYVLTLPEPTTVLLLALGGAAVLRRRR
jgi:hypothetical protein